MRCVEGSTHSGREEVQMKLWLLVVILAAVNAVAWSDGCSPSVPFADDIEEVEDCPTCDEPPPTGYTRVFPNGVLYKHTSPGGGKQ